MFCPFLTQTRQVTPFFYHKRISFQFLQARTQSSSKTNLFCNSNVILFQLYTYFLTRQTHLQSHKRHFHVHLSLFPYGCPPWHFGHIITNSIDDILCQLQYFIYKIFLIHNNIFIRDGFFIAL